ncbi:GGDEF domain-containing protein [Rhizobium sp. ARZ01]|uniref:GGDEF domain-containing protein n=1 Tax=Rhizobium sp. ARZ01 TaxID=2769313 RepID=UPI00178057E9|nr:GGDEF domain-containing protein [Rhizobium sp. ARZ01]MBD9372225.1 GGDEF domain-containing protein [Rhizobium sp. ARZ01]
MLEVLISVPTLMVCTFLSTLVVAIFLTQHWLAGRGAVAAGYWCVSMWVGSAASFLLALRGVVAPEISIGMGNGLAALGYALSWAGFRAFDDQRVSHLTVAAGVATWTAAYSLSDTFAADMNMRIMLMSLIVSAYSLAMASQLLRGRRRDALPSRWIVAFLLTTHAAIYALRIPFAILAPVPEPVTPSVSPWLAAFALEIFLHTLIVSMGILVLIKERSEFVFRHAARSDALTGILNRGALMDEVAEQLRRRPEEGVLMLFDLDHFKSINDTHGHMAGDQVLRRFTSAVNAKLGEQMVFGRFGGEEFALFAPELDLDEALAFADTIRADVAALSIGHYDSMISVTVSVGLASAVQNGGNIDNLVADADSALYRAKQDGRNCVSVAGPADSLKQVAGRMRDFAPEVTAPLSAVR